MASTSAWCGQHPYPPLDTLRIAFAGVGELPPRFGGHVLLFRVGRMMYWLESERRNVTQAKLMALGKVIVRNARRG